MTPGSRPSRSSRRRRGAKFITPIPKPKKRKAAAAQAEFVFDEGKGLSTAAQQYDPTSIINEVRGYVEAWRALPNPSQWQVTPETARLLQHWRHHKFGGMRPFFCQVEAVGNRDLAHRGRAAIQERQAPPRPSRRGQQGRQSGTDAARAEARHRRRQDHRHGHAHRVADHQCGAAPGEQEFHPRLSDLRARPDHQGPAARAPAQRPRQLLRQPRTRSRRHARRCEPGQDRHHQLPRLQAARAHRTLQGRAPASARPRRRGTEHAGDRRADDPARHARPDGHEEHPRHQRRGAPLLPGKAERRRRRGPERRREEGSREEQRGGAPLDFRPGSREPQARPQPRHRPVGDAVLPAAAPAMPRAPCSRGR